MEQNENNLHDIKIEGRTRVKISGVDDVIGFDETAVALVTTQGTLNIEGEELHIIRLDVSSNGCVEITGKVNAFYYTDTSAGKKRKLFGRRDS